MDRDRRIDPLSPLQRGSRNCRQLSRRILINASRKAEQSYGEIDDGSLINSDRSGVSRQDYTCCLEDAHTSTRTILFTQSSNKHNVVDFSRYESSNVHKLKRLPLKQRSSKCGPAEYVLIGKIKEKKTR
jgi:hypothetical protein